MIYYENIFHLEEIKERGDPKVDVRGRNEVRDLLIDRRLNLRKGIDVAGIV